MDRLEVGVVGDGFLSFGDNSQKSGTSHRQWSDDTDSGLMTPTMV